MRRTSYLILIVFALSLTSIPSFAQTTNIFTVKNPAGGQPYSVNYSITGATINDMLISTHETSLIISLNSTSNGNLVINLPRNLIDAKAGLGDDRFIVLVDDTYTTFHESKTDANRTLSIAFTNGTQRIEIIGTQVLPEFGSLSLAILAVSVMSIVAISAKIRFKSSL
ncbi:MAG: PEFG-CTERM sorting domain-containing protein [Thaumarchaeota archaeon]|nr:PEFG-CTERM sorting domain-containing protein [Nitrososphaerota archaeon]